MRRRHPLRLFWLVFFSVIALFACPALAETRRIAIVVGNNAGGVEEPPLRFAEDDAGKMARILVELGAFSPNELLLLQGRRLVDLEHAIGRARAEIESWHGQPDVRVLLFFYFSGHSDGHYLEIGQDRLAFAQLRSAISSLGADVRLIVLDSCKSGSALQSKGGTKGKAFEIQLADDLPNSGEAVITSSAANESSLESPEIRGSFFTHHLLSGLRGAADISGDGRVSLAEAYDYAFTHTLSATADTSAGTQHPSFDYRLSGQGELVLTELREYDATLITPPGYRRMLVTQLLRDQVVAELTTDSSVRLTLPAGLYSIRAWKGQRQFAGRVRLENRAGRTVGADDLVEIRAVAGSRKGSSLDDQYEVDDEDIGERRGSPRLSLSAGVTTGVAQGVGAMTAGRMRVRPFRSSGLAVDLDGAVGEGPGFTEYRSLLLVGPQTQWGVGRLSLSLSAQVGGGAITQRETSHTRATPGAALGVTSAAVWWLNRLVGLTVQGGALVALYERDTKLAASLWPEISLGLSSGY